MAMHNFKKTIEMLIVALATDAELTVPVCVVPFPATVQSVEFVANAAITGANTNTRKHELINKGSGGAGTTVVAELQYNSGVNAAAFDAKAITNSATAANLDVEAGDVLAFASTAPGSGQADPGGLVRIVLARRAE